MNPFPDGGGGKDHTLLTLGMIECQSTRWSGMLYDDATMYIPFLYGASGGRSLGGRTRKRKAQAPLVGTTEVNFKST